MLVCNQYDWTPALSNIPVDYFTLLSYQPSMTPTNIAHAYLPLPPPSWSEITFQHLKILQERQSSFNIINDEMHGLLFTSLLRLD